VTLSSASRERRETEPVGVVFDLDGVVVDSEELQFEAYARVLARFGVTISRPEYGREWIGAGRGPEYAVAAHHLPVSAEQLRAWKGPIYRDLIRREARLMPGARAALARLRPSFRIALATNSGSADTEIVLERFDLARCFDAVVTREQYDRRKPAPDAFRTAAACIGCPPSRCVVVEDSHRGVVAASRAGCACIVVPHAFTLDHDFALADRVVSGLDDVTVTLVRELLERDSEAR
jgi:HAD superfamily hydrolase (TIGR01509 family)